MVSRGAARRDTTKEPVPVNGDLKMERVIRRVMSGGGRATPIIILFGEKGGEEVGRAEFSRILNPRL